MNPQPACILQGADSWSVGMARSDGEHADIDIVPLDIAVDASPDAIAQAVATVVASTGDEPQRVVLALDAVACLTAALDVEPLPRRERRQAMVYMLEEHLPLAAEDYVADFVEQEGHGQRTGPILGIASDLTPLTALIEALEHRGIQVEHICPQILLALQGLQDPPPSDGLVLWRDDERVNLLRLRAGRPIQWRLPAASAKDLRFHVAMEAAADGHVEQVLAVGLDDALCDAVQQAGNFQITRAETPLRVAAAHAARRILRGDVRPLVDLRRDQLAGGGRFARLRRPLTAAAASAALCVIVLTAALFGKSHQYAQLVDEQRSRQHALFSELRPAQQMPVNVHARLVSELRQLRDLRGNQTTIPQAPSALPLLNSMLMHLPVDLRFRLLEISIDDGRLYLEGQVRTPADAERLAAAIADGGGFTLDAPRTQKLADQGFGFTLNGQATPIVHADTTTGRNAQP